MSDISPERLPSFLLQAERFAEGRTGAGDFRIGHVLARTCSILKRHFLPFFLLCGVASLLLNGPVAFTNHESSGLDIALACTAAMVLYVVCYAFVSAVIVDVAMDDMGGRPVDVTKALRVAWRRYFPALGVTAIVMVAVIVGFILLVVPGLFAVTLFFVAMPVCVVEGLGPIASLRRSRQITKGHRWRILALGLASFIIGNVVQMELDRLTEPLGSFSLTFGAQVGWDVIYCTFAAVMAAVAYRDLRIAKEGVEADQVATVFD
jgi:hypothetical protein